MLPKSEGIGTTPSSFDVKLRRVREFNNIELNPSGGNYNKQGQPEYYDTINSKACDDYRK